MAKVRLKDIADATNMSITAVSLVLNNKPNRVSKENRLLIKETALKMNYHPNMNAKNLVTKTSTVIGVIVPDIENPFFASLCREIEKILSPKGIVALFLNSDGEKENDIRLLNVLTRRSVLGILLVMSEESTISDDFYEYCKDLSVPLVLLDRNFKDGDIPSVYFDSFYGGQLACEYLQSKGHTKIACISGPLNIPEANQRYLGCLNAMDNKDNLMLYQGSYNYVDGENAVKEFAKHDITAIFSCNDLMAYGAVNQMRKINKDYEIVGYDKSKSSDMFGFNFPSIFQDVRELAQHGLVLLEKINNSQPVENIVLKPVLSI